MKLVFKQAELTKFTVLVDDCTRSLVAVHSNQAKERRKCLIYVCYNKISDLDFVEFVFCNHF